jgi:hypothetical protein
MYNKYRNKKVEVDGITFASKREMHRYLELKTLEAAGEITNLKLQEKYILIPVQREFTMEIYTKGRKKGQFKQGKIIERECAYFADFDYVTKDGKHIVEDTKGMKTKEYIIKRKLMLHKYGIRITEI